MKKQIDIAYIISHGFASRMLLQTDLLGKLHLDGLNVVVITPDKNDYNLRQFALDRNIEIIEYNPKLSLWNSEYFRFRKYIFEEITENPALLEKHFRDLNKAREDSKYFLLLKIKIYYLIYKISKILPWFKKIISAYENIMLMDRASKKILDELKPNLLISTYPVNLAESRLLYAGNKTKGVKTVIHLLSWDNITCKGRFPQLADYYISWGEIMMEEFREFYNIDRKKIFNTGVPHFDLHFKVKGDDGYKQILLMMGLNPEIPYLFFAMSSPYFSPYEIDIVEHIANDIHQGKYGELQLVVRPHPQNIEGNMADDSWIPRLKRIKSKVVAIDWPRMIKSNLNWSMNIEDMVHFANLVEGCQISINSGSTVAIDSLLHDKPVILTLFDADKILPWWKSAIRIKQYRHCLKLIQLGGGMVVSNFKELEVQINHYLTNPLSDLERRQNASFNEVGVNDGKATERVILAIKEILSKEYFFSY